MLVEFGGKDEFIWDSMIDPYYAKYRPFMMSRRNSNSSMYYDTIDPFTRPPSSFSVYGTPIGSLTPVASHTNLNSLAKAYSTLSLQSKIGNGMPPRLRSTIKTLFVTPTSSSSSSTDLIGGVPSWVLSEKLNAIRDETSNDNNNNNWLLTLIMKCEHTVRYVTIRILKKMIRYKRTFYWMVACFLLRNGVQELIQHVFMLMMQVVLDFNSVRNTVGLRSILNGQMTL